MGEFAHQFDARMPLDRLRVAASREKRAAKSPPIERTAARATWGLEQVMNDFTDDHALSSPGPCPNMRFRPAFLPKKFDLS